MAKLFMHDINRYGRIMDTMLYKTLRLSKRKKEIDNIVKPLNLTEDIKIRAEETYEIETMSGRPIGKITNKTNY